MEWKRKERKWRGRVGEKMIQKIERRNIQKKQKKER